MSSVVSFSYVLHCLIGTLLLSHLHTFPPLRLYSTHSILFCAYYSVLIAPFPDLAYQKGKALLANGCVFNEFGSRRRRSLKTHDLVMQGLKRAVKDAKAASGRAWLVLPLLSSIVSWLSSVVS